MLLGGSALLLREEPGPEFGIGERLRPTVVADAGILGVFHLAASLRECGGHVAGEPHGNGLVISAVEGPYGDGDHFRCVCNIPTATDWSGGGEEIGVARDGAPASESAHGLPDDVDTSRIDGFRLQEGLNGLDENWQLLR